MARKPRSRPPVTDIRFDADFDDVTPLRTVSYRVGDIVRAASAALVAAAGDKAVAHEAGDGG